jgi:hypothetical protein
MYRPSYPMSRASPEKKDTPTLLTPPVRIPSGEEKNSIDLGLRRELVLAYVARASVRAPNLDLAKRFQDETSA